MYCKISVEEFREMFRCQDKYPRMESIRRCIIDVAKKELDAVSPISFNYECNKVGTKIKSFTFHFYKIIGRTAAVDEEKKGLLSQYPLATYRPEVRSWLKHKLGFTTVQLKGNAKTIEEFQRIFQNDTIQELEETFQYIAKQGFRPQDNIGWFIQNLKKKVENTKQDH